MTTIRQYEPKDRPAVERICAGKAGPLKKAFLTCFCNYYIEREPENCFVAANEADECVGYVLCASDFQRWAKVFQKEYYGKSWNPVTKGMGKGTVEGFRDFAGEYPAHLHIDIDDDYQRQGIGTRLIDALTQHLKKNGVKGVMFSVAADNEKGKNFYNKYGFVELSRNKQEINMGMKLL